MRSQRGFTLIELMIVVVIIGTLAAIAIPRFQIAAYRAKEKEAEGVLKQVYTLQRAYYGENGRLAANAGELGDVGFAIPNLQYYAYNPDLDQSPYCLTKIPLGANHTDRCIELDTGLIRDP